VKKEEKEKITGLVSELLNRIGIKAGVKVAEKEETIEINIEGENLGILIGRHGVTLRTIQLIISMMVGKQLGEWQQVAVDVNGWRLRRQEQLERMANRMVEEVISTSQERALPPMSAFERRIIHLALASDSRVVTESIGEDPDRYVTIKPKSS
jgi:spoIIIJ-associated protein